jgi:hypothetical protein
MPKNTKWKADVPVSRETFNDLVNSHMDLAVVLEGASGMAAGVTCAKATGKITEEKATELITKIGELGYDISTAVGFQPPISREEHVQNLLATTLELSLVIKG